MENLIYAYQVKDKDSFFAFAKKRESGEKPERTGHCKQEIYLWKPLHKSKYARRKGYVMICESGNLPGVRCAPDTA